VRRAAPGSGLLLAKVRRDWGGVGFEVSACSKPWVQPNSEKVVSQGVPLPLQVGAVQLLKRAVIGWTRRLISLGKLDLIDSYLS
jgi:hypothetical protein